MLLPWRFALLAQKKATLINAVTWVKNNPTPRQFDRRLVSSTEPFFHFVKNIKTYHYDLSVLNVQEEKGVNPDSKVGQGYFKQIDESDLSDEEKANAYVDLAKIIEEVKEGKIESLRMKIRGKHSLPFGGQEGGRKTQIETKGYSIIRVPGGKMHRDVVETPVETIRGINHPAIYPRAIVEQFIKTTTHPGDLVFDPFIGSGTTGLVAKQLGRNFIGFELCPEFAKQAQLRIESGVIA
jgi:site-specific DNA-methyltransferase (adenine-specific)